MNLNPMFSPRAAEPQKEKLKISKPRKKRSDKKHDIKIPVSKLDKQKVLLYSRLSGLSEKKYCTGLIKKAFELNYELPEIDYQTSNLMVHINPDKELYSLIVNKSVDWCYESIRMAAYRIFMEALRIESGEIIIEGL
ncbi:hypothetical protein H1D32_13490 [Anaerobacillus sp. CMMVII]|uniref:hypothetical protein n=1 Tax=Anaerobacillus sp. CMMVII TaxID=2755588 RepID=UPI0021B82DEE|nr:hypothetical protein [Anaerobacillus sp. CMMVII]MCT8138668.1 hypothetical protein [Anaerobacillus sp. CMMVII]